MSISIVLADDEVLLRKALASLLPLEGEIRVLAEAEDGADIAGDLGFEEGDAHGCGAP